MGLFCLSQVTVWTLIRTLTSWAPPRDTLESYGWGHEWVIGTYKHPNLPGWALEVSRRVTGATGWPSYLTSELFVAATYLCVFMLGREMMGARRALAGTMLLAGLYFMTYAGTTLNHNLAMMPFWAAIAWVLWSARTNPGLLRWTILGALGALSLYAKLSSGLLLITAALWIVYDPKLRSQLLTPWPWAGLAVFGLLLVPLYQWLAGSGYAPLLYAKQSADVRGGALKFLFDQLLVASSVALVGYFAGLIGPRKRHGPEHPSEFSTTLDPAAIPFLATLTILPHLLMAATVVGMGSGARFEWAAPMLNLCGLLLVAIAWDRFGRRALGRIALAALALLCILPASLALHTYVKVCISGGLTQDIWPQAAISARFQQIWQDRVGKPMGIVAGSFWIAGLVALKPGPMASVYTDADMRIATWITPERLRREGALVVWRTSSLQAEPPVELRSLVGTRTASVEQFTYPLCPRGQLLLIAYAIVPPE